MSERTPQPETVRERFDQAIIDVLDRWLGIVTPRDEWQTEIADIHETMASLGLTIIDTAALEPGEDDGDGE